MPNATTNSVGRVVGQATRETGTLFGSELWWRDHYHDLENQGDSFTHTSPVSDFSMDAPFSIAPSNVETSTFDYPVYALQPFPPYLAGSTGAIPGYQHDVVQNIEFPPLMGGPGHGSWSNKYPQGHVDLTGPYSALNPPHDQALAPYTSNVGHDSLTHPTTDHTEYRGEQTHHGSHHMSIVLGPPQLEDYTPMAPLQDLNNDDPLGHMPHADNVAGPSRGSPSPVRSRMWDDEDGDLKRLASRYLNNPSSYVNEFRIRRRRSGGRKVSIMLEIDS